jgi:hypothetical protein
LKGGISGVVEGFGLERRIYLPKVGAGRHQFDFKRDEVRISLSGTVPALTKQRPFEAVNKNISGEIDD